MTDTEPATVFPDSPYGNEQPPGHRAQPQPCSYCGHRPTHAAGWIVGEALAHLRQEHQ